MKIDVNEKQRRDIIGALGLAMRWNNEVIDTMVDHRASEQKGKRVFTKGLAKDAAPYIAENKRFQTLRHRLVLMG